MTGIVKALGRTYFGPYLLYVAIIATTSVAMWSQWWIVALCGFILLPMSLMVVGVLIEFVMQLQNWVNKKSGGTADPDMTLLGSFCPRYQKVLDQSYMKDSDGGPA